MTRTVGTEHPVARAAVAAIRSGDLNTLERLLAEHDWLATARVGDDEPDGMSRTLLHVATDWPGHFPRVADTVRALVSAGADPDARFRGPHAETPLHWAASSDDVDALDALLDAGADIEADGAVLGGGTAIADARGFKQWAAAHRLLERGARTTLHDEATLGLIDRLVARFEDRSDDDQRPDQQDLDLAFWGACHGGRLDGARFLREQGADLDVVPRWEPLTPLDAAEREGASELVSWLRQQGARRAGELP